MRCNQLFTVALTRYNITDSEVSSTPLGQGLTALLSGGVTTEEGCMVLRSQAHHVSTSPYEDQLGREAWANKFRVEDYEPRLDKLRDQLIQALKFVTELPNCLLEQQHHDVLVVISLVDPEFCPAIDEGDELVPHCVVRFYQLWPGQSFLDEELEKYQHEALATFGLSAARPK